ncbi:MAG TPA: rhodanese-like domain-containing protein [Anaerolineales bacterium]|nr:rhodanese-like domain-containing protein [Anaerolineales bacterium]
MSKKLQALLGLLIVFSLTLGACAPVAEPVVEEPPAPVVEEPALVEEPMEEDVDINMAFGTMLANMTGYNTIKADGLLVEMAEDTPPFLLDVRSLEEVEKNGHIPGATHVPLNELAQNLDVLPSFDTPIVTYCAGGWRATIAMTALHGMGWTNVRALKVKFADWKDAGNPVEASVPESIALNAVEVNDGVTAIVDTTVNIAKDTGWGSKKAEDLNVALVEKPDMIMIDVRKASELEENGVIAVEGQELLTIPMESFVTDMAMWPADKDAEIVVYCGSGHRSTMAMTILLSNGYTNVTSLSGGFGGWNDAGYATVGGIPTLKDTFGAMLANMKGYNTIKTDGLLVEMIEATPPFILDVRSAKEVSEQGHIVGAVHIPLNELAQHTNLLPSYDTPIVTYCAGGWRATIAMTALHGMGWTNVRALKVPFAEWKEGGNPVVEGLPEVVELNAVEPVEGLATAIVAATVAVKDMGTKWGIKTADDLNVDLVEKTDFILMDVRKPEELTEKGVIAVVDQEFIALPIESFETDAAMWPADKDAEIVIYCGSGHRSTMAMTILLANGYTNVTSLNGGYGGWTEAGYAVTEYVAQ